MIIIRRKHPRRRKQGDFRVGFASPTSRRRLRWDRAARNRSRCPRTDCRCRIRSCSLRITVSLLQCARPPAGIWSENEIEHGLNPGPRQRPRTGRRRFFSIDRSGDDRGDKRSRDDSACDWSWNFRLPRPDATYDRADRTANNSTGDGAPDTSSDRAAFVG
jgi:hypothetical protein